MGVVIELHPEPEPRKRGGNNKGSRRRFGNVRKLPSGRFQASYAAPDGTRVKAPTTFDTRGDATAWLDMQSAAITEHRWKPAPPPSAEPPTFREYVTDWLAKRDLKPRTRAEYKRVSDALAETFGDHRLNAITRAEVDDWFDGLDATKPTARAHRYALLRTIMGTAVTDGYIDVNPAAIPGAGTSKRVKEIKPATVDQIRTIAAHMPERYRCMVLLATWCALRFGELTELRRKDLDLDAGTVRVDRAVTWVKPAPRFDGDEPQAAPVVGTPKSDAGRRTVAIPPHIIKPLADHLAAFVGKGPESLVFPNTEGGHVHHGSVYKVFKPARKAAGREDLRWHDLRHTGATMAAQAGATLAELMGRLGHSSAGVAMRYQHVAEDRDAALAAKLSAMVGEL